MFSALLTAFLLLTSGFAVAQNASSPSTEDHIATDLPHPSAPPDSNTLVFLKIVPIHYPQAAQQTDTQGNVVVKMTVTESGDVESADVVSGDPVLAGPAADSVKQWKFQPYIKDGKPVRVSTTLRFWFAISDGKCTDGVKQATVTTPFEHKVTVTQEEMQGYICKKISAAYPRMAELARVSGDVVMAATIGKNGTIQTLHILSSASPLLNQSAIDAVKQWRYRPYRVSGQPVEVETTIRIAFR